MHIMFVMEMKMVLRFRLWWKNTGKTPEAVIVTLLVVLISLLVVIILGYSFHWKWTGLSGKTLWDWLQFLIIPAVLAVGGYLFNYSTSRNERQANENRAQAERDIALDNQQEVALQAYIDSMSELLLHENLRESDKDDEVRNIARVRTLTILTRLNAPRKRSVLQFLFESDLIGVDKRIIELDGADLQGIDLSEADLFMAYLSRADLSGTDLYRANLGGADLSGADLSEANLHYAHLDYAHLSETDLHEADLVEANLSSAKLRGADLSDAKLSRANLSEADLSEANLFMAELDEANLKDANLNGADLTFAVITTEQLDKAKSLQGATMPDGSKHA
jgi:uncharacterized protein YjbI with pentapeptide repeats